MASGDRLHELRFGAHDVCQGLAGFGMGTKGDEIDRVAGAKRDANLAIFLETADACPMPRARVNDHIRSVLVENLELQAEGEF